MVNPHPTGKVIDFESGLASAHSNSSGSKQKILIAHHLPAKRSLLRQILECSRYELLEVSNTTEALTAVSVGHMDLVIVEMETPEVGAVEFCRILKKASGTRFLPIFVTSSKDDIGAEVRAIEAGADAYLLEPYRPAPMQARIQAILRHKSMIESLDDSETVLFSLAESVEGRDPGLGRHCERLAQMCLALGASMGLPPHELLTLQRAGYLHDIGKVAIPDSILFKSGALSEKERNIMQSHAERGERICKNIRSLAAVLPVIRHHHEKWNGTGYPDGLAGEEIPLLARILQTADIYDALTTERPYKGAFTPDEAIKIMRAEAAKGWRDPKMTEHFSELLPTIGSSKLLDMSQMSLRALSQSLQRCARDAHQELELRKSRAS